MEVACTLVCPKANQEVIVTQPNGSEMQKCDKCEGDCPKGLCLIFLGVCDWVYFHLDTKHNL